VKNQRVLFGLPDPILTSSGSPISNSWAESCRRCRGNSRGVRFSNGHPASLKGHPEGHGGLRCAFWVSILGSIATVARCLQPRDSDQIADAPTRSIGTQHSTNRTSLIATDLLLYRFFVFLSKGNAAAVSAQRKPSN
jgi:hypothetical protein